MNSATPCKSLPTCAVVQRSASRGFTLLELMTVVVIIAIFAAIALPTVTDRLRERRSANLAHQVVQTYRLARMRAMGRGAAVLVRWDEGTQQIVTREAIAGTGGAVVNTCALSPIASCTNPPGRWDSAGSYSEVGKFNPFSHTGVYELTRLEFHDGSNTVQTKYDICFTPAGATFARTAFAQTAFGQIDDVPNIKVWSEKGGVKFGPERFVYVLPNGVARIGQ